MNTATAPRFPLPRGWYFGWRFAPAESVSGYHGYREALLEFQERLEQLGYVVKPDGFYGTETRDATIKFQRASNLKPDGKIGRLTWAAAWA
jgi:peptidoglycan hydrolase-like protein with peptidoglycan-binding domain